MDPVDSRSQGEFPPPVDMSAAAAATSTMTAATATMSATAAPFPSAAPTWTSASSTVAPGGVVRAPAELHPMAVWRILGAVALIATFALMGWQVQRLGDDQPWSNQLMWMSVATSVAAAACVLVWTWTATDNAKRLVEPAKRSQLPDPMSAVLTWIGPFAFVAVATVVVTLLGARTAGDNGDDVTVSTVPISVAVVALLLAVPMTYRPLNHLAAVVRQVGGYSVQLARWMWVPVVMGLVSVGSIVALRFVGAGDEVTSGSNVPPDLLGAVPLWVSPLRRSVRASSWCSWRGELRRRSKKHSRSRRFAVDGPTRRPVQPARPAVPRRHDR